MKIFDVYKESQGHKIFLTRIAAVDSDMVQYRLYATLPAGERYLAPEECTDPLVYQAQIQEAQRQADTADVSLRAAWQAIVAGLQKSLAALEAQP